MIFQQIRTKHHYIDLSLLSTVVILSLVARLFAKSSPKSPAPSEIVYIKTESVGVYAQA